MQIQDPTHFTFQDILYILNYYEISHLLSRNPLMCRPYDVVAKECLPEIVDTYPNAIMCNTHDAERQGEHWIAMYVDAERRGDYFDPYGLQPQHVEFANFMNEHCSEWAPNDRTLQSHLSTVCGQYCVAFLIFRSRNVSMHGFTRLFTTDLVANDCRVFDWLTAVNKKMCVRVCYLDSPLIGIEPMTYLELAVRLLDFDMKQTGLGLSSARGSRFNQSERRSSSV